MTPDYSRESVNRIGKRLIADDLTPEQRTEVLDQFNDWRAMHLVPMNTFQVTLRKYIKEIDPENGIVTQRLKRMPTIIDKLKNRYRSMKLGQLHDVGGLRAVVADMTKVRELERKYDKHQAKHKLQRKYDYIAEPRESGYRGIHLVYAYNNSKKPEYEGLLIEIQLRTRLQHIWATAVETIGTFFAESLKSSQGPQMWLDFFKLVSAVFALEEKELPHKDYRDRNREELLRLLRGHVDKHGIFSLLNSIHVAKKIREMTGNAAYYVIELRDESDKTKTKAKVSRYYKGQEEEASDFYREIEQSPRCRSGESQVVLVSVDSFQKIEKAYPNFFQDISDFYGELKRLCGTTTQP